MFDPVEKLESSAVFMSALQRFLLPVSGLDLSKLARFYYVLNCVRLLWDHVFIFIGAIAKCYEFSVGANALMFSASKFEIR